MDHDDQPIIIEKPSDLPGAPMSAAIGFDYPCCFCGYNLNSLTLNGNCPECGSAVNDALRGSRMQYQPIGWILRLKTGAQIAFWGTVAMMLTLVVFTCLIIFEYNSATWWMPYWIELVFVGVYLSAAEIMAIGMLMLSVSAPIRVRRKQLRARVSRTSALCVIVSIPVMVVMMIYQWNVNIPSIAATAVSVIASVMITIGCPLLYFFGLSQISMLASLIPWKKGMRRALVLQIFAPAAFVVWLLVYVVFSMLIMSQYTQSPQSVVLDWVIFLTIPTVTVILFFVGLTMTAALLLGLSKQINAVAAESVAASKAKSIESVWHAPDISDTGENPSARFDPAADDD